MSFSLPIDKQYKVEM